MAVFEAGLTQRELERAIESLGYVVDALEDTDGFWESYGEYLLLSHVERIERQVMVDETPLSTVPLSESYLQSLEKQKSVGRDLILVQTGTMESEFFYEVGEEGLIFGSNQDYAAGLHFGNPAKGLKPRPFIGVSDADQEELGLQLIEYIRQSWENA